MPPLPPAVAAALDLPDGWPVAHRDRTAATLALRRLDRAAWIELCRWAWAACDGARPPSHAAWASLLGISPATLRGWRCGVRYGAATGRTPTVGEPELAPGVLQVVRGRRPSGRPRARVEARAALAVATGHRGRGRPKLVRNQ